MAVRQESLSTTALENRARGAAPRDARRTRSGWLMTTPFFVLYFLFLLWPVISAAWKSLFSDSLAGGASNWRGLGNYGELLGDSNFWWSMWHTLWFTVLSSVPLVILPLALALLVNRVSKGQWLFRLAFFAPYVLPVSVIVLIWQWLYQPGFGLINGYLTKIGLDEVNWLGAPGTAMLHPQQRGEGFTDDGVVAATGEVGDHGDATGVMLELGGVEPPLRGTRWVLSHECLKHYVLD